MTTRTVAAIAAVVEMTAGFALIANPSFVVHLLIGAPLSDGGIAIGRVGGFGLLSLGLACWPSGAGRNRTCHGGTVYLQSTLISLHRLSQCCRRFRRLPVVARLCSSCLSGAPASASSVYRNSSGMAWGFPRIAGVSVN